MKENVLKDKDSGLSLLTEETVTHWQSTYKESTEVFLMKYCASQTSVLS